MQLYNRISKGELMGRKTQITRERILETEWAAVLEPLFLAALLLVCTAYLVDGSFSPFLYFRF